MDDTTPMRDVMDDVIEDTEAVLPELDVIGLPITGRVLRLARHLESRREEVLSHFDISVPDFDVLATLRRKTGGSGALKIRDLQRSMMLSSGGTTKRLDRLEKAQFIERLPDPEDRRGTLIGFTRQGLDTITAALEAITRAENEIVAEAIEDPLHRSTVADGLRTLLLAQEELGIDVRNDTPPA